MGKTLAREWLILVAMISTGYGPVDIFATRCASWTARRGNSRPLVQISVWWTQRGEGRSVRRHQPPQFLEPVLDQHWDKANGYEQPAHFGTGISGTTGRCH